MPTEKLEHAGMDGDLSENEREVLLKNFGYQGLFGHRESMDEALEWTNAIGENASPAALVVLNTYIRLRWLQTDRKVIRVLEAVINDEIDGDVQEIAHQLHDRYTQPYYDEGEAE
ncbi:MAG: hypothetical protein ABEL51_15690 [Salinibacter sp.]